MDLCQARNAITGGGDPIYFGPKRESARIEARRAELQQVANTVAADPPASKVSFTGGEHEVWVVGDPAREVFKKTLEGAFGRILDERNMVDFRTCRNVRQFYLRSALPSEYLRRWEALYQAFRLPTVYQGPILNSGGEEPSMAITQPYITQDENDQPDMSDVVQFMEVNGFTRVEGAKIALPELKEATWYRCRDGLLITDVFPRNFRKDADTGELVPIDLIVTVVPKGASQLLPDVEEAWVAAVVVKAAE